MERRKFSQEFKLEAVKLVRERGVTVAPASPRISARGTG
jgi:transposase-like protein